jgi:hypothetical protein
MSDSSNDGAPTNTLVPPARVASMATLWSAATPAASNA